MFLRIQVKWTSILTVPLHVRVAYRCPCLLVSSCVLLAQGSRSGWVGAVRWRPMESEVFTTLFFPNDLSCSLSCSFGLRVPCLSLCEVPAVREKS